jgi:hypothetical protein
MDLLLLPHGVEDHSLLEQVLLDFALFLLSLLLQALQLVLIIHELALVISNRSLPFPVIVDQLAILFQDGSQIPP